MSLQLTHKFTIYIVVGTHVLTEHMTNIFIFWFLFRNCCLQIFEINPQTYVIFPTKVICIFICLAWE